MNLMPHQADADPGTDRGIAAAGTLPADLSTQSRNVRFSAK
ncbi:MAG: hypothetical protein NTY65_09530 [Planctomycetota bacterium]|nr:hypothetical protein [Planctomycetota bacterium]